MNKNPEKHLIKGCLKGDRKSQNILYENYKIPMFRLCLRFAKDKSEAEDLLQESFIKVYKDLKHYKNKGALGAWIRKVTLNISLQHVRSKKNVFSNEELDEKAYVQKYEDFSFDYLDAQILTKLIQQLPPGYRAVFNLFEIEEYKHKEIAELLNISISTSKSQLHKAKAILKEKLESILVS